MTLHDMVIAHGYWKRNPPLRMLLMIIATALGVPAENFSPKKDVKDMKPEDFDLTPKKGHMTAKEFERLMAATGGRIEGVGQYNG